MTEWHSVGSAEDSGVRVVARGFEAEDHQVVTGQAAVIFDHGDQMIVEGPAIEVARTLRAAADLVTRPDLLAWEFRSVSVALDAFSVHRAAHAAMLAAAHQLATLLADTITAQVPATYLVLDWSDHSEDNDRLILDRLCDVSGRTVHSFTGFAAFGSSPGAFRLPGLPREHPLAALWRARDLDPADPLVLQAVVCDLVTAGGEFGDRLPEDLPDPDAPTCRPCLALTSGAVLERPNLAADYPRLLRPHRLQRPCTPTADA